MPKRTKRDPSYHFLVVKVNDNDNMNCVTVVRIPERQDDDSIFAVYQPIVDKVNAIGPHFLDILTIVSVNKNSKSAALLKFFNICPGQTQASAEIEDGVASQVNKLME